MILKGEQREELHKALLNAFDKSELERVVSFKLNKLLETITKGGNLSKTILDLIHHCEKDGEQSLNSLVKGAYEEKPGNENLKRFHDKFFPISVAPSDKDESSTNRNNIYVDPQITVSRFWNLEQKIDEWKKSLDLNIGYVYSAPAAAFLSGEHAVVYGHLAVYHPLPLRLYVYIKPLRDYQKVILESYIAPNPQDVSQIAPLTRYKSLGDPNTGIYSDMINDTFEKVIYPFLKDKTGFQVKVFSMFPLAVGLNSSGAFSVCLAKAWVDHFLDCDVFLKKFHDVSRENMILVIAWLLENSSHGNSSSGAGVHASYYGRTGKYPLFYVCSKRTRLANNLDQADSNWHPVNLEGGLKGIANIAALKTMLLDPAKADTGQYPTPPDFNLTIIYSGNISRTNNALSKSKVRQQSLSNPNGIQPILEEFNRKFTTEDVRSSVLTHTHSIVRDIILNSELQQKQDQINFAWTEVICDAIGYISIGMINSILSDWNYVPDLIMSSHSLLSSLGQSTLSINSLISKIEYNSWQYQVKLKENSGNILPKLGAKFTGAGNGGDILIFSLYPAEIHRQLVGSIIECNKIIHFDNSSLPKRINSSVEGVRLET